jgi:predicted amidophosphoribosyltransferase
VSGPPRRRSVADVAAPYANLLVPVPPTGPDLCTVCHSPVRRGYTLCYPCAQARRTLGSATADAVAFVSLAPAGEQFARDLYTYKRPRLPAALRRRRTVGLAAVLWRWLDLHEPCLARQAGVARFDVLTSVPSTSGRDWHPLRELVGELVSGAADRYADLLAVDRTDRDQRAQAADRFRAADGDAAGRRVLVVDDTWTTGAHAQSASAALKAAGAAAAGVVALGRWLSPEFGANQSWLAGQRRAGWNWERCCLERAPR